VPKGWVEVEEYGEAKLDFLRRFVPFDHGIASHDTFSGVFNALDPEGFKAAFIAWTATLQENVREIVAIKPAPAKAGGKTLRRSFDRGQGQGPIHMISAWAAGQRVVLGQLAVGAKENEITAIPELLALLSLKGAILTIDAIGCQKKIAVAIRQKGADYLLALKENQPTLYRDVADFLVEQRAVGFQDCAAASWAEHHTSDADHGRIEPARSSHEGGRDYRLEHREGRAGIGAGPRLGRALPSDGTRPRSRCSARLDHRCRRQRAFVLWQGHRRRPRCRRRSPDATLVERPDGRSNHQAQTRAATDVWPW